ncbi:hypothetical protein GCM10022226_47150 [Sphaerisporangium flaviroseum]|uniref:Antitoxin VbhA domain-containing protein n=1 Tax=Sphaerisporangium flaviroseum TaxID=509199 RepID=A0ABP7ILC6_9ACTN
MSDHETELTDAMAEAVAAQRLEGLTPTPLAIALMEQVAAGDLSSAAAVEKLLEHYRA